METEKEYEDMNLNGIMCSTWIRIEKAQKDSLEIKHNGLIDVI
ncbi:hypothetical protein [Gelidibacter japonicus]|nr:hypothetical protein [Gelidibacter japonicus]